MVKITITIDGDNITVNQSGDPTKVETSITKRYFIVMGHCNESSFAELVTENYIEAVNKLKTLRYSCTDDNYSYSLHMQENGQVTPCNSTNFDINK